MTSQPLNHQNPSDGIRTLLKELASLRASGREMREQAIRQHSQILDLRRHNALAKGLHAGLMWRHYALCHQLWGPPAPCSKPPKEIPAEQMERFSMNGQAVIENSYIDATYPANWPVIYSDHEVDLYLKRIAERRYFIYGMTDIWLWEALERFPIRGKDVVNMGSLTPWYESVCIHHGARPTTIDYNKILSRTQRIRTMTVAEADAIRPTFDAAFSISSFEHDGLGMYGDPLDPDGDLKAMHKMKSIVKPDGLLFLSVPVGADKILFNNARIYGRIRLPLLIGEWDHVDTIGLEEEHLSGPGHIQPILILRNRKPRRMRPLTEVRSAGKVRFLQIVSRKLDSAPGFVRNSAAIVIRAVARVIMTVTRPAEALLRRGIGGAERIRIFAARLEGKAIRLGILRAPDDR